MPGYPKGPRGEYMILRANVERLVRTIDKYDEQLQLAQSKFSAFKKQHPEITENFRGEVIERRDESMQLVRGAGNA